MRPTDKVLEEEVFFCIYLAVRPTDRVLEEEVVVVVVVLIAGGTPWNGRTPLERAPDMVLMAL